MKIKELELNEINRLGPDGFGGGKDYLSLGYGNVAVRKLPGGSGLFYSVNKDSSQVEVKLWDKKNKGEYEPLPEPQFADKNKERRAEFDKAPGRLVGTLSLEPVFFPIRGALQVNIITIDEEYRGQGLATALYGIVLTIMKRPILAGSGQTTGGQKNWVSLASIPGVEIKGYVAVNNDDIDTRNYDEWNRYSYDQASKKIDIIMGKLGGQYIGKSGEDRFFAFDVKPNSTGKELEAYVKTKLSTLYSNNYDNNMDIGLYAVWTGQL